MARITRVANVEEAIELAEKWKAEGKYNWFRGQLKPWDPASSLERKVGSDPERAKRHMEQLNRFSNWVRRKPELAYLAEEENVDKFHAILQHYGIPTCYVDFSTSPGIAGFFSADCGSEPPPVGEESVIYCLDTDDLVEFYKKYIVPFPDWEKYIVEPVTVDISNLWRLEAQAGHFLYTNHAWYKFYPMDKIVFPWTGYPAYPSRETIYPEHKSVLENALDHFFFQERRFEGREGLNQILKAIKKSSSNKRSAVAKFTLAGWKNSYNRKLFRSALRNLPSWSAEAIHSWVLPVSERLQSVRGHTRNLNIRDTNGAASVESQIRRGFKSLLSAEPGIRNFTVDWNFPGLDAAMQESYPRAVRTLWNGMRNLPYSDDEICTAASNLYTMLEVPNRASVSGSELRAAAREWSEDVMEVEFSSADSTSSRAFCSMVALMQCVDREWDEKFVDRSPEIGMAERLQICYSPRLIFDFEKFRRLFATEIIPSQIAIERPAIIFNPALLENFGLP